MYVYLYACICVSVCTCTCYSLGGALLVERVRSLIRRISWNMDHVTSTLFVGPWWIFAAI